MTAAIVPPKTITAAVICIRPLICPPSHKKPPTKAMTPTIKPIIVDISILVSSNSYPKTYRLHLADEKGIIDGNTHSY
ncbi:hypothetical protein D3C77_441280 [compost metagenome]